MDGIIWAIGIGGGLVALGLVVFLFGDRQRRLTKREKEVSQQTARENWGKEEIR
jgi:hypothetical protein